jgi:hypothetical protein
MAVSIITFGAGCFDFSPRAAEALTTLLLAKDRVSNVCAFGYLIKENAEVSVTFETLN